MFVHKFIDFDEELAWPLEGEWRAVLSLGDVGMFNELWVHL